MSAAASHVTIKCVTPLSLATCNLREGADPFLTKKLHRLEYGLAVPLMITFGESRATRLCGHVVTSYKGCSFRLPVLGCFDVALSTHAVGEVQTSWCRKSPGGICLKGSGAHPRPNPTASTKSCMWRMKFGWLQSQLQMLQVRRTKPTHSHLIPYQLNF